MRSFDHSSYDARIWYMARIAWFTWSLGRGAFATLRVEGCKGAFALVILNLSNRRQEQVFEAYGFVYQVSYIR